MLLPDILQMRHPGHMIWRYETVWKSSWDKVNRLNSVIQIFSIFTKFCSQLICHNMFSYGLIRTIFFFGGGNQVGMVEIPYVGHVFWLWKKSNTQQNGNIECPELLNLGCIKPRVNNGKPSRERTHHPKKFLEGKLATTTADRGFLPSTICFRSRDSQASNSRRSGNSDRGRRSTTSRGGIQPINTTSTWKTTKNSNSNTRNGVFWDMISIVLRDNTYSWERYSSKKKYM